MRTALAITIALLLACSGMTSEEEVGNEVGDEVENENEVGDEVENENEVEAEAESEAEPAAAPMPKAAGYTNNVYGVCRKYLDCECSLFPDVPSCVEEFGEAKEIFPPSVWSCVLARDCTGLCEFNAGTCFELYALQYTKGSKQGASDCPDGTLPIEYYDAKGDYLRTECKE